MKNEELLEVATYAGEILLKSGAEIYRVEETIKYIMKAYGIQKPNVYILRGAIFISYSQEDLTFNKILAVQSNSLNLFKVNLVNNLSRKISRKPLDYNLVMKELKKIDDEVYYKTPIVLLASGICCFAFTLFFGGNIIAAICSIFVGIIGSFVMNILTKLEINNLIRTLLVAAILTLGCLIVQKIGLIQNVDSIIIGCFMLLVPGIAIENAIQDSIRGDYICGLTRALEAFLIAIMIAVGSGAMFVLWRML